MKIDFCILNYTSFANNNSPSLIRVFCFFLWVFYVAFMSFADKDTIVFSPIFMSCCYLGGAACLGIP